MRARGAELVDDGDVALSDGALLAACSTGDRAALGRLFDRHHGAVHRFLIRAVRATRGEADDLVQDTFVAVWRAASSYRGNGAVRSWILGISANVARHHVREEVRRRAAIAALPRDDQPVRGPDDAAMQSRLRRELTRAVGALPPALRDVFTMCELDEIPGVEAARRLGLPPGTLWRRLYDARRALRVALDEEVSNARASSHEGSGRASSTAKDRGRPGH